MEKPINFQQRELGHRESLGFCLSIDLGDATNDIKAIRELTAEDPIDLEALDDLYCEARERRRFLSSYQTQLDALTVASTAPSFPQANIIAELSALLTRLLATEEEITRALKAAGFTRKKARAARQASNTR